MIIDTHAHLNDKKYLDDLDEVLDRSAKSNIMATIIPGADPRELEYAVSLSQKHSELFFAVGVHPYDIEFYDKSFLQKYINHPKCVAVGECGLDYFRLPENEDEKKRNIQKQKDIFIDQIDLAKAHQKPLIVHIREASHDSLEILKEYADPNIGGVLHCFNASPILLELVNYNFYYGIGGVLTFKNAKKLVEILPKIPLDRIIFETDAPYLTPHPHRGERNEPSYINLVIDKASEILGLDRNKLEEIALTNTHRLFGKLIS